jgi:hypothetical protein
MKVPIFPPVPAQLSDIIFWLNMLSQKIVESFKTVNDLDVIYIVPAKPQPGMIRYFGVGTPSPITHEGQWIYTSAGWKPCNPP